MSRFRILARTPAVLDFLFVFFSLLTSMLGVWATLCETTSTSSHLLTNFILADNSITWRYKSALLAILSSKPNKQPLTCMSICFMHVTPKSLSLINLIHLPAFNPITGDGLWLYMLPNYVCMLCSTTAQCVWETAVLLSKFCHLKGTGFDGRMDDSDEKYRTPRCITTIYQLI